VGAGSKIALKTNSNNEELNAVLLKKKGPHQGGFKKKMNTPWRKEKGARQTRKTQGQPTKKKGPEEQTIVTP